MTRFEEKSAVQIGTARTKQEADDRFASCCSYCALRYNRDCKNCAVKAAHEVVVRHLKEGRCLLDR